MSFLCPFVAVNGSSTKVIVNVCVYSDDSGEKMIKDILKPGEVTKPNNIYQNGNQHWYVEFSVKGGGHNCRHAKECGFEYSDNGQIALIVLYPDNFSIIPPQSSNCLNNHY